MHMSTWRGWTLTWSRNSHPPWKCKMIRSSVLVSARSSYPRAISWIYVLTLCTHTHVFLCLCAIVLLYYSVLFFFLLPLGRPLRFLFLPVGRFRRCFPFYSYLLLLDNSFRSPFRCWTNPFSRCVFLIGTRWPLERFDWLVTLVVHHETPNFLSMLDMSRVARCAVCFVSVF